MIKSSVICDRCGKTFKYSQTEWGAKLTRYKLKPVKILKLMYGNPSGYDYVERKYDICGDCTKALDAFMRGENNV